MQRASYTYDHYGDDERDNLRPEEVKEGWDVFENPITVEEEGSMADQKWFDCLERASKFIAYIVVFILVLSCAIISKGTLLFMTSQLSESDTKSYCNRNLAQDKHYIVTLPTVERVMWIWILIFAYCIPQIGTFIRSLRIVAFKTWAMPGMMDTVSIAFTESCSTIGFALLIFGVLPELDVVKGAMLTNAVCFIPAVLALLSRNVGCNVNTLRGAMDIISITAQATAFITWPLLPDSPTILWLIPVSLFLISIGWWENFTPKSYSINFINSAMKWLCRSNKAFVNDRYFVYIFVSLWKCILFFISVLILFWAREDRVEFLFNNFELAFSEHYVNVTEILPLIGGMEGPNFEEAIQSGPGTQILTNSMTPWYLLLINALTTYVCYAVAKFACKIQIQGFGYALPVNLAVPVTISGLIAMCGEYNKDVCAFYDTIPTYLFFDSPPVYLLADFITQQQSYIWLLWLISQTWITIDLWTPLCEKLARTEKLFVRPMFEPFCLDQDLGLNRRRDNDDEPMSEHYIKDDAQQMLDEIDDQEIEDKDSITMIYACGTMWHETKSEMMAFMKSILRLDEDQLVRMKAKKTYKHLKIPNLFNFETHIFFDDAFYRRSPDDPCPEINPYVKDLIDVVNEAVLEIHNGVRIRPPAKLETPYGGRLEWKLPGGNKMYAHLKDKTKIRAKKRWSQVMYMYYLLGHRLMDNENLSETSKWKRGSNTYILALDGDIDFQPKAVHLLADLMKKNRDLGAACGRIHPMGSGAMVWYQKFEYAIGHWLQKATEHMIGCVLCSPGCFSLFRGSALMDDSVMNKYTTTSEEAVHFVQYDQGEDRWLCTLLLQRGHKVEYSAASDSFTHCPEGFTEFYKQRRRWMPSTTANIIDLLMNYRRTVDNNDNISTLYIGYQLVLLIGTVLGPGTIFLMLVGAFVAAFQVEQWTSFLMNGIPIITFMIICGLFKENVQLIVAGFLSTIYGLVMMAVLVGIMLQIQNDGILAPSSLFFFCVAGEMIITALFHPKEIGCLPYGIVYYVTVPSMYMLLVIYSVFNMNNISWGTRDGTVVQEKKDGEADANAEEATPTEKKNLRHKIYSFFSNPEDNTGSFELSFAGLFRILLCTSNVTSREEEQIKLLSDSLRELHTKLDGLQTQMNGGPISGQPTKKVTQHDLKIRPSAMTRLTGSEAMPKRQHSMMDQQSDFDEDFDDYDHYTTESSYESSVGEEIWLHCDKLRPSPSRHLHPSEESFWTACIARYLTPINEGNTLIAAKLKDLRDKAVFTFFMLNAVFVLVVFLLTLKKDDIHIKWPLGIKANFTYQDDTGNIEVIREYLQLEPIGFVFLIFFAILLIVQFVAMFFHRFGTFSQILANTKVNFTLFKPKSTDNKNDGEEAVMVTRRITRWMPIENGNATILPPRHRATFIGLIGPKVPRPTTYDLSERFELTHDRCQNEANFEAPVPRQTLNRLMRANSMAVFRDPEQIEFRERRRNTRNSRHNITSV